MFRIDSPLDQSADINYNLYYSQKNKPVNYLDYEYTFSEWQNMGHEKNGLNTDPKLKNDFTLSPKSPAINNGCDISDFMSRGKKMSAASTPKKFNIGAQR